MTQALHEDGVVSVRDFERLKGRKFGVPALGSVNQYNASFSLLKAKLDPAKDVEWVAQPSQPELMRMIASNDVAAADFAYQLGLLAQNNKWGPIIINDDVIVPDAQISVVTAHRDFLARSRDTAVRFAMASHTPQPYQLCYCSICRKTAGGGGYAINLMGTAGSLEMTLREALKF